MLKDLFSYTEQADKLVIDTFESTNRQLATAEYLFSHVLNAQHIWLSRINNTEQLFERFHVHPKAIFRDLLQDNLNKLYTVLDQPELDRIIHYKISTGEVFENRLSDILFHIVNHSTYHRGQIASQFRLAGITPPVTDFVFLKRQGIL